jgi:hypothetical protein
LGYKNIKTARTTYSSYTGYLIDCGSIIIAEETPEETVEEWKASFVDVFEAPPDEIIASSCCMCPVRDKCYNGDYGVSYCNTEDAIIRGLMSIFGWTIEYNKFKREHGLFLR